MPITVAAIITASKVILPIAQTIYNHVQAYRHNTPEAKKIAENVDLIAGCVAVIAENSSLSPDLAVLQDQSIEQFVGLFKDIETKIADIVTRGTLMGLARGPGDKSTLKEIAKNLDHYVTRLNLFCSANNLSITTKVLQTVQDIKSTTDETLIISQTVLAQQTKIINTLDNKPSGRRQVKSELGITTLTSSTYEGRVVEQYPDEPRIKLLKEYMDLLKSGYPNDPQGLLVAARAEVDREYATKIQQEASREQSAPDVHLGGTIGTASSSTIIAEHISHMGSASSIPATTSSSSSSSSSSHASNPQGTFGGGYPQQRPATKTSATQSQQRAGLGK